MGSRGMIITGVGVDSIEIGEGVDSCVAWHCEAG